MKRYLLSGLFLLFMLVPFRAANKTDLSNELESALAQPILAPKGNPD